MFLLLKALREVADGSDAVSCGQLDELLDQVLFLCHTQERRQERCSVLYICTRKPLGIQMGRPGSCYTRGITGPLGRASLPFSNSSLMASSVMASWVGSAFGIVLIFFIASPLHLRLIVPGRTRPGQVFIF